MVDRISDGDLLAIVRSQSKLELAKSKAELALETAKRASAEARLVQEEYRNVVNTIFIKYNLDETHQIDEISGAVSKKVVEEPVEEKEQTNDEESE